MPALARITDAWLHLSRQFMQHLRERTPSFQKEPDHGRHLTERHALADVASANESSNAASVR